MNTQTPIQEQISFSPKTVRRPTRRERRSYKHRHEVPYNNNRKPKGSSTFLKMLQVWNDQAIHIPRRKKFKGYQREARRYKKAA